MFDRFQRVVDHLRCVLPFAIDIDGIEREGNAGNVRDHLALELRLRARHQSSVAGLSWVFP